MNDEYIKRCLKIWFYESDYIKPDRYYGLKKEKFIKKSLRYWAATEILKIIESYNGYSLIKKIEELKKKSYLFYKTATTDQAKNIFLTLYEVVNDVLDYLNALLY